MCSLHRWEQPQPRHVWLNPAALSVRSLELPAWHRQSSLCLAAAGFLSMTRLVVAGGWAEGCRGSWSWSSLGCGSSEKCKPTWQCLMSPLNAFRREGSCVQAEEQDISCSTAKHTAAVASCRSLRLCHTSLLLCCLPCSVLFATVLCK